MLEKVEDMMNKDQKHTKQNIQQTALDLFSKQGYSAVSIRDIGKLVGIKESTIYYHYKNKQDIFQELLKEVQELTNQMEQLFQSRFIMTTKIEKESFILVGLGLLENYLLDQRVHKFISMLSIERHVNKEAALLYQRILFDNPINHNILVFKQMLDSGYFKNGDAESLALEYYSYIYFTYERYFTVNEVKVNIIERANLMERAGNEVRSYLSSFYDKYSA